MDESRLYLQEAMDSGTVVRAEILHEDGSVWASAGRPLTTEEEGGRLVGLFEAPADAIGTGITVGEVTYVAAEADRRLLHGRHGSAGVVAVRNPPYVVVGLYEEGRRPEDAVLTLGNLADRLADRSRQTPAPDTGTAIPSPP
ncbi:profilin [Streptomyces sp. NPDC006544]|uniref:profilin n=1 Tax=Streptomyces sp. NPDC006544 TaxID=3154583 RepID=UPI0033A0A59A